MASKWICFFSQTGSEIANIVNKLKITPDLIITNRENLEGVNSYILNNLKDRIVYLPSKPVLNDYDKLVNQYKDIFNDSIITLHGFLRIIPGEICNSYNIYNLHPGLITKYPELKGFNPQEKAFKLKLKTSGSVIHKVIAEVDSGEILDSVEIGIDNLTLDQVYQELHNISTELWVKFLTKEFK